MTAQTSKGVAPEEYRSEQTQGGGTVQTLRSVTRRRTVTTDSNTTLSDPAGADKPARSHWWLACWAIMLVIGLVRGP